jgi:hypothetical protein
MKTLKDHKAAMVAEMKISFNNTIEYLYSLTPEQWTDPEDEVGWTVKDHVSHLTVWAASIIAVIEKQPRWEGMGVSKEVWDANLGDYDAFNQVLRQLNQEDSYQQVMADFISAHEGLLALVVEMSMEDLSRPFSDFQPWFESATDPLYGYVQGNSSEHYDLHLGYIQKIVKGE